MLFLLKSIFRGSLHQREKGLMDGHKCRFQKLGGAFQLIINDHKDLEAALTLDEALWMVNSAPCDGFICDSDFLKYLDGDGDGRVRTDDVKDALQWLFKVLKDRSAIDRSDSFLHLDTVNGDEPEGNEILSAAALILKNLGCQDSRTLSLEQVRDRQKIVARGRSNGDGIIPPESTDSEELASFIRDIMEVYGSRSDLSGEKGVGKEELGKFKESAKNCLDWLEKGGLAGENHDDAVLPWGKDTHEICDSAVKLSSKIDEYFDLCRLLRLGIDPYDSALKNAQKPENPSGIRDFMLASPLAAPRVDETLIIDSTVNPVYRKELSDFASKLLPKIKEIEGTLSISSNEWDKIKQKICPYLDWKKDSASNPVQKIPHERLKKYIDNDFASRLNELIEEDELVAKELKAGDKIEKVLLFQKNFLRFGKNFISIQELFDPSGNSLIQAGTLVMDGRRFTLTMKVSNIDDHKKTAEKSNICVMYLAVFRKDDTGSSTMNVAVTVTSGFMRNLFPGKNGIFFTPDKKEWDAKVIDFIRQPVSLSEAAQMPFVKTGEFFSKQFDKFFSSRFKDLDASISKTVQSPTPPPPQPQQQSSMLGGSMLLMGGSFGVAALGSSFAYMANILKNVPFLHLMLMLFIVVLLIGGPVVALSVYKLSRRNLGLFLEASGWAVNSPLRLTRRMGKLFTGTPDFPADAEVLSIERIITTELKADKKAEVSFKGLFKAFVFTLILIIILMLFMNIF